MFLRGHEPPQAIFRAAAAAGRLASAYLLTGPAGIGKAALADRLAATLLCGAAADRRPCGACDACGRFARGAHPSAHRLRLDADAHEIKIESVRALLAALSLRPADGGSVVALIDDADRLSEEGQNALLKILEEPPPYARFLLVSSRPSALLPTVRSRCQVLRCVPLPEADVVAILRDSAGLPPADAAVLASLAGGSPGRALGWHRSGLLAKRDWIAAVFESWATGTGHRGVAPVMDLAGEEGREQARARIHDVLDLLLRLVDALGRGLAGAPRGPLEALPPPAAVRWAERLGPDGLASATEQILDAQADIDHNVNSTLAVEDLFLRLGSIPTTAPA